jgi:hypothetical protein
MSVTQAGCTVAVRTVQQTTSVSITVAKQWKLIMETVAIGCLNHTELTQAVWLCGENAEF